MTDDVKFLDATTNAAIFQLSGRRLPGLVLQGDTLHEMHRLAAAGSVEEVRDQLAELLDRYRRVLLGEGLTLPLHE